MSRRLILLVLLAGLGLSTWSGSAPAAEFRIEPGAGNKITFTSRAPLESFDGHTDQVRGRVVADLNDLSGEVEIRVEVDLASLDTGIGLRNRHMRDNHLQTKIHPLAVFQGGRVSTRRLNALRPGQPVNVTVDGTFTLHGVSRPLTCRAELTLLDNNTLQVLTEFTVSLEAFAIPRPKFLVVKLADIQEIKVELLAKSFS